MSTDTAASPSISLPLRGHCYCGAISFEYNVAPLYRSICHCTICQRISGSALGVPVVGFLPGSLKLLSGQEQLKSFDSTAHFRRFHCSKCFAPVHSQSLNPAVAIEDSPLAAFSRDTSGDIERYSDLHPQSHVFYENVKGDLKALFDTDNLEKFDQLPPME